MKMAAQDVFVVLRLTRGAPETVAVFLSHDHAQRFTNRIRAAFPGTYRVDAAALYEIEEVK